MPEIEVDGRLIWYSVYGDGEHAVLVLPGAIGTVSSDFEVQFNSANADCFDFKRFKWIFIELHGWGRLGQERQYGPNVLMEDASYCHQIMKHLDFKQYSIYAWSEGAKVALILAHRYGSKVIRSVIVQAVITYKSKIAIKRLMWSRNVENWDPSVLKKYIQAYDGKVEKVKHLWNRHMDYVEQFNRFFPNGLLGPPEEGLQQIQCPTLVMHGEKDFFVELEQSKFIADNIPGAKLIIFPNGHHNFHQIDSFKFKKVVENFLSTHLVSS